MKTKMDVRRSLGFLIFFLFSTLLLHCSSLGLKKSEPNDSIAYVTAKSGLFLREKPGKIYPKITLVPFGKEIIILKYTDVEDTIENIRAKWVEVKYKDFKGYMFSGFLSNSPFTYGISDQFHSSNAKPDDHFDALDPNLCKNAYDKVYCFSNHGYKLLKDGYYKKATTSFTSGLNLEPNNHHLLINRGYAYTLFGDYEKSLIDFEKAIQVNPNGYLAYFDRAVVYTKLKKFDLALLDLKKSIQHNSQSCMSYNNLGWVHLLRSEWEKAKIELEKARDCDPGSPYPYANLAIYHYMTKKDKVQTFELLKKALELHYDIRILYDNEGDGQFYKEWNQSPEFLKFIDKNKPN
ncbi:TPR-repeat-containing protein [Leptospira biflexa serovar Patoc strain 'Patoc 1 (Ames)']|uniref:Putative TPR-repeat-containing protein putative signal peptide n=2 Tax=Leptospira biflexa TaxID=172 RepID=B0SNC5_LEPBP|nr:SH3 domain-containing protein [Leptospira biflexa]ABZ95207.1 TPR-repeat-containing protein [Leptospira biflexa serovar Patoc strain 'Patoc 1 (Ames)']ABZ98892.1 Putative TPR-repeat-containing protein; putative signal peptide [Leptospira biflexa serovar Patoc strain 'Patoc 1 (Paris)']